MVEDAARIDRSVKDVQRMIVRTTAVDALSLAVESRSKSHKWSECPLGRALT